MADLPDFTTDTTPTMQQLVDYRVDSLTDVKRVQRFENAMRNAHAAGATVALAAQVEAAPSLSERKESIFDNALDTTKRFMAKPLAWLVGEILGVEVPANAITNSTRNPEDSVDGKAVAAVVMHAIKGHATSLEPSEEPAQDFLGVLAHIITHCWAEGIILEQIDTYTTF